MSAPYQTLHAKAETAGVAWTVSQSVGTAEIYGGKRALDKAGQCVTIYAEKSVEDPPNSQNYRLVLKIIVSTPFREAADSTSHNTLVGKVFDAWSVIDPTNPNYFAEQLSGLVTDFTVFGFFTPDLSQESGPNDRNSWQDEKRIGLYCCAADIS